MDWMKNNKHMSGWSCLHEKDSNQQSETKKRALEILSEDFIIKGDEDDYTLLSIAVIHLSSIDIAGDQWFGVWGATYTDFSAPDKGKKTAYIQCDNIIDGVLELVRWDAGDYDHLKNCLDCSHKMGEHKDDGAAFCDAEECECTGLHVDVGDCGEECFHGAV